jgi:hypothetical protein
MSAIGSQPSRTPNNTITMIASRKEGMDWVIDPKAVPRWSTQVPRR